jgi:curved DNA-binding protein CbpA
VSGRLRTREWSGVDYYAELGLAPGASRAAVDEAYRRQAKALHPDRNPEATAEDRFKRLSAAYEVLRDPATRQAYDDFRFRVNAGLLYAERSGGSGARPAGQSAGPAAYRGVPPRVPKVRRAMPNGVRIGIGYVLIVVGFCVALFALVGDLPSHTAGDSNVAVAVTLGIVALKLLVCGVIVIKYPALKARWHRAPKREISGSGERRHSGTSA